ncbi:MAG: hypothetical protein M1834_003503 [Cirrosporium novae-zelandiae]|nr:MAG: hypothetical protein M1834_003503 [Cirrosporium novae-zelandiae]
MLRLKVKSHSFYLASGMFRGRLRIDLVLLAADDLIDNAQSRALANNWISILTRYLDIAYDTTRTSDDSRQLQQFVINNFPSSIHSTLFYLPTAYLDPKPFHELIQGFKTDIDFISPQGFPIRVEDDLHLYASRVAGTVADLCLQLVFHHTRQNFSKAQRHRCVQAGMLMGNALQLVNVARDVVIDAQIGRVYLPLSWLQEIGITPEMVIRNPDSESVKALRHNLLRVAFDIYMGSRSVIEELPKEARGPMRVAVEQYMEIGRVLQERNCRAPSIVLVMAEKEARKTALVVGAGIGGVSTAARLAKAGFSVTILEKNEFAGGRCSLLHHHDWRFDQGPSLLLLPRLFEETFQDLDTSLEDEGVHLLKCEPNYKLWFGDGESIELSTDLARMKSEVEKWEGKDGFERYLRFLQEAHRHYEISVEQVLKKNFTSIFSMARPTFLRHLLDLHPFESIYTRASKYFWTERLRRAFTFASMYMGMSPFDAPGTYSLLQYTEIAEGIWYPEGGFHRVVDALVNVGKRLGVEYRLSTTVDKIKLSSPNFSDNRHAQGVILASGEELLADVVVVNADLVYAYKNLLPPSSLAESLQKRPASCSSISFYWALNRKLPELHTHNIFLADDYKESFDDIFKHQLIPKQPSFYVNVPSRIDPTAAPNGKESVIVLVPVGHLLDKQEGICVDLSTTQDWDGMVDKARETIISTIQARTGARKLKEATVNEFINTPLTWKPKFNLDKGAILGLSHSFFNILSFRPKTKHPRIGNLYFVGASTHPGTGVPICLAGSRITTEQILEEFKLTASWLRKRANVKVAQKSIDKVRIYPLGSNLQITLLILLIALLGAIIQSWELKGFGYGW